MPEILEARRAGLVTPARLSPPGGFFVALVDDGQAVAGGGVLARELGYRRLWGEKAL